MTEADRPVGQRYTRVYLDAPTQATDNPRMRNRIAEWFYSHCYSAAGRTQSRLRTELGVTVNGQYEATAVRDFLKSAQLHDFLDALTIAYQVLLSDPPRDGGTSSAWVAFVTRAMDETGVSFEMDAQGGVHPKIDSAFVAGRQSAIQGLGSGVHGPALAHFELAYGALDGAAPSTGLAIREMHLAIETVFKRAFPKASRLDVAEINNLLKPAVTARLSGPEREAAKLMLTSAGNFVSAAHQFRHADGSPEPALPSMQFAVWMLSQGTGFLRWLVWFVEDLTD